MAVSSFDQRMRGIVKKHRKMSNGKKTVMNKDGLVTVQPKSSVKLPLFPVLLAVAGLVGFKGYLLFALGEEGYGAKLAMLQDGTIVETLGAKVMQADVVTLYIRDGLTLLF